MPKCSDCETLYSTIKCLDCENYYCLNCSNEHQRQHLLDLIDHKINWTINQLEKQLYNDLNIKYQRIIKSAYRWIDDLKINLDKTLKIIENMVKQRYDQMKIDINIYINNYIKRFESLRINVRHLKRTTTDNNDYNIKRLATIQSNLYEQFQNYTINFDLNYLTIDFTKYFNINEKFYQNNLQLITKYKEIDNKIQSSYTININSIIQYMCSSCLDLFIFITDLNYSKLIEYRTNMNSCSPLHTIDFPKHQICDIWWSKQLDNLLILTSKSVHKYDKYYRKITLMIKNDNINIWYQITTNRLGIFILCDNNLIEYYDYNNYQMKPYEQFINDKNIKLIHNIKGQEQLLALLIFETTDYWRFEIYSDKERLHTIKLDEFFRPPISFCGNEQDGWILPDIDKKRLIYITNNGEINDVQLLYEPNNVTILDDFTLVISTNKGRLVFYDNKRN